VVWGDGEQRRELIYVDDAIDAMMQLLPQKNEVFNLGSGQDHSINDFARKICEIYEYDSSLVRHDMTKYVGVREKRIDTSKVERFIEGEVFLKTTLDEGLRSSIDYFCDQMAKGN